MKLETISDLKNEIANLKAENEKLKREKSNLEIIANAWSEECGNRFVKLKEKDEEISDLKFQMLGLEKKVWRHFCFEFRRRINVFSNYKHILKVLNRLEKE